MITWIQNWRLAELGTEYPIIEVLRECRRAIGLGNPNWEGDMRSSRARILFVEDDADTRELVRYVLTRANYEVQLAENAEEGTTLARSTSFDLYLIDNWMPGSSGMELCTRLRAYDADTPILFLSGAAYEKDKREAIAAGAQGYLTKPANIDHLLAEVSRLIGTSEPAELIRNCVTQPSSHTRSVVPGSFEHARRFWIGEKS